MRVRRTFLGEDEDEDEGKHEMRVIRVMMRATGGEWTSMIDVGLRRRCVSHSNHFDSANFLSSSWTSFK